MRRSPPARGYLPGLPGPPWSRSVSSPLEVGAERTIGRRWPSTRRDKEKSGCTTVRERAADPALDDLLEQPSVPVGGQVVGDTGILRPNLGKNGRDGVRIG